MSDELREAVNYLNDMGLPEDKEQYLEIVEDLQKARNSDIEKGITPIPECMIPGMAFSMLQTKLVAA